MKKDLKQKGFTFIEVIVTLFLFSILMGILWQFFGNAFTTYLDFDKQTNLTDHSRIVSSFIREEIRFAEQITIITTGGAITAIHPPEVNKTSESSLGVSGLLLDKIELRNADTGSGIRAQERTIELRLNPSMEVGQGKYRLLYVANSTESLISDKVENIKITREQDSPVVQFECTIHAEGETQDKLKVKNIFSESLEYKGKYDPLAP